MISIAELAGIVGQQHVTPGEELLSRPQDFWNPLPTYALALVKPANVAEVSALLAACNRARQPVIAEGGRTNLAHSIQSTPDTVLMSLERLQTMQPPDPSGMTIEVEAGVVLENLQNRCAEADLRFGLDLGARGSAMIGGLLSTNAGGFQALRYGVARDQVLGLECVLADGTVLSHLVPYTKDNTGYDLKHLFIGAEGTLGVITRAMLKLHPRPTSVNTALLAFDSFDAVARTLRIVRQSLRGTLSCFEIMWAEFYDFNVDACLGGRSPVEKGLPYYVLCEAEGFDPDADEAMFQSVMGELLETGDARDVFIAQSSRHRADVWKIREEFEPEKALFPVMIDFDISLSMAAMEPYVRDAEALLAEHFPENLGLHVIGHLGDGNLHVTTGFTTADRKLELQEKMYALINRYRGSISAEHGIGLAKKRFLAHSRSPQEIATMRLLKNSLDPHNILNPGKIF